MRERRKPSTATASAVVLELNLGTRLRIPGHRVGRIVGGPDGKLIVDYPGNPHGPLVARTTVALSFATGTAQGNREALLVFEDEWSDRPIIVGALVSNAPSESPATVEQPLEVRVDGDRVVLEGKEEVVLRCGQASITLRKNGRVVVRGTYVETRSQGVNRIKGGTVQIN